MGARRHFRRNHCRIGASQLRLALALCARCPSRISDSLDPPQHTGAGDLEEIAQSKSTETSDCLSISHLPCATFEKHDRDTADGQQPYVRLLGTLHLDPSVSLGPGGIRWRGDDHREVFFVDNTGADRCFLWLCSLRILRRPLWETPSLHRLRAASGGHRADLRTERPESSGSDDFGTVGGLLRARLLQRLRRHARRAVSGECTRNGTGALLQRCPQRGCSCPTLYRRPLLEIWDRDDPRITVSFLCVRSSSHVLHSGNQGGSTEVRNGELTIDLNCDMGELPQLYADGTEELLMQQISSANIACGAHAGSPESMEAFLNLATRYGVAVGAHISYPDRPNFGRREVSMSADEIEETIYSQASLLAKIAADFDVRLSHVK